MSAKERNCLQQNSWPVQALRMHVVGARYHNRMHDLSHVGQAHRNFLAKREDTA